jgi:hypothetical protein
MDDNGGFFSHLCLRLPQLVAFKGTVEDDALTVATSWTKQGKALSLESKSTL